MPDTISDENYTDFHQRTQSALASEISAVKADLARWGGDTPVGVLAAGGEDDDGDVVRVRVTLERAVYPPDFSIVTASSGSGMRRGVVEEVAPDGRSLLLAMDGPLSIARAGDVTLSFDPTALLVALSERFEELAPGRAEGYPLVRQVLGYRPVRTDDIKPSHPAALDLNEGQQQAISRTLGSDVVYAFGPPGTGKTRTLGALVAELVGRGERIMVTAHTNTALDTALEAVCGAMGKVPRGTVLRVGKLSRGFGHLDIEASAVKHHQKSVWAQEAVARLGRLEQALDLELAELRAYASPTTLSLRTIYEPSPIDRASASADIRLTCALAYFQAWKIEVAAKPTLRFLRKEFRKIEKERLGSSMLEAIRQARVVGVTLSRLAMNDPDVGHYDTVAADEGSMIMLPQLAIAAARATRRVAVFGDPCQLPPVVQCRGAAALHLGRDVFEHVGISDPSIDDPRRPILTTQYRMRPAIRAVVSSTFYGDRLEDGHSYDDLGKDALLLADTSHTGARAERSGSSWVNRVHADLVAELVARLGEEGETDLGIIAPYAAQVQVIKQALRRTAPGFVRDGGFIGTVHKSQGGERSTIILDLVDAPGSTAQFLDERRNPTASRILNVACSRAQNRLIVIAHAQDLRRRHDGHMVASLIKRVYREGRYCQLKPDAGWPRDGDMNFPKAATPALSVFGTRLAGV